MLIPYSKERQSCFSENCFAKKKKEFYKNISVESEFSDSLKKKSENDDFVVSETEKIDVANISQFISNEKSIN